MNIELVNRKWFLWLECVTLFIVIPLLFWMRVVSTPLILIPVFILCVPATIWLGKKHGFTLTIFWYGDRAAEREQLRKIIIRFCLLAVLFFAILLAWYPDHLFDLPRNMTMFWLLLIVLYPLFSVYPQELLYRAFFFHRYRSLFKNKIYLLLLNALMFGWMHIVFHNMLAIIFTFIGAFLFADTYRKTRSLRLTCLEHALYGNLLFTLGYGEAFLYKPLLQLFSGLS